jgi:hypothetical protein
VNGTRIPTVILTTTNNVMMAMEDFTLSDDFVKSVVIGGGSPNQPTADVTVDYVTVTINTSPGGNPTSTPESSSLLLLGSGLLGVGALIRWRLGLLL